MEKFPFLFFVRTAPGVQLGFSPCLFVEVALRHLFPPRKDKVKGAAD